MNEREIEELLNRYRKTGLSTVTACCLVLSQRRAPRRLSGS